jgi:hypothetical protein
MFPRRHATDVQGTPACGQERAGFHSVLSSDQESLPNSVSEGFVPKIKGAVLLDSVKSIKARGGDAELSRIVASLNGNARAIFEGPIYPWEWYPLDAFTDFLEADIRETAGGNPEALIARSEKVIETQLRGIYRVFVKLGSPGYVVKRIASVHQTYFEGTEIIPEVDDAASGATVKYIGFKGRHRILEYAIIGFYRKALEISGAKQIAVRFSVPISDDAPYSELIITWA